MQNKKRNILLLMGTRPEVIKLAPLAVALKNRLSLRPIICLSGQHAHMAQQMLVHFHLKPDTILSVNRNVGNLTSLVSCLTRELSTLINLKRPDLIVVQGDTTSAMVGAIAGFYERIPVAHVEAGLRTFDLLQPFPEEFNRRVISIGAAVHFCPTKFSAENLRKEGIEKRKVHVVGNTCIDALLWTLKNRKPVRVFTPGLRGILVTAHRRENWSQGIASLCKVLSKIVKSFPDVEILFPVHRNPIVQNTVRNFLKEVPRIRLVDPMDYYEFSWAMKQAHFIITDSGGVQEEALALGTPVLVTRNVTERPEVLDGDTVRLVGNSQARLWRETSLLLNNEAQYKRANMARFPFGKGNSASKIANVIERILSL